MSVKIYKLGAGATTLEVGLTAIKGGAIGRVLFEGSGSVLQESSNFFWDNTNSWLGIGTATPSAIIHSVGSVTAATAIARGNYLQPTLIASANNDVLVALDIAPTFTTGAFTGVERNAIRYGTIKIGLNSGGQDRIDFGNQVNISRSNEAILTATTVQTFLSSRSAAAYVAFALNQGITEVGRFAPTTGNFLLNTTTDAGYKLDVNGTARVSGTTTITPATLTGATATSALDISQTWNTTGTPIALKVNITDTASAALSDLISLQVGGAVRFRIVKTGFFAFNSSGEILGSTLIGGTTINTSSQLEVRSTTKGFLPPRMTTAEKNAIATPASGLVVYDTTLGKLCVRGAAAWETITSV